MEPGVPIDPILETELRKLAQTTIESDMRPKSQTRIPVVQVSFSTANKLLAKLNEFASSEYSDTKEGGPAIQIGNDQAAMIPNDFRQQHKAVLKGNATYMDVLTRGQWGVNLVLKSDEWQLGITRRVAP